MGDMTLLELYHADRSTCSQKVRICLAELGLQYRSRPINLIAGEQLEAVPVPSPPQV